MTARSKVRLCRDSASLIILARNNHKTNNNDFNYKVLSFKRTEKTSFMANHIVFPGGVCELSDQSRDWINHFKKYGVSDNQLKEITRVEGSRPPIFQSKSSDPIKREISLRISAIRETFEELGILICRKKDEIQNRETFGHFFQNDELLKEWQGIVHNDSTKFLELCQKLEIVPDLWSLYEWSVWKTPAVFDKRFETAFFLVALNKMPTVIPEQHEVQDYLWKTPTEYLSLLSAEQIFLPPPQIYEFSRISKYLDIGKMAEFARQRNHKGTTLFLPVQYRCSNGIAMILPGDDAYPSNPDEITDPLDNSNETVEAFRKNTKHLHRSEYKSIYKIEYFLNIQPFDDHLSPIQEETLKSKL